MGNERQKVGYDKDALSLYEPGQNHFLGDDDVGCEVAVLNHRGYLVSYSLYDGF